MEEIPVFTNVYSRFLGCARWLANKYETLCVLESTFCINVWKLCVVARLFICRWIIPIANWYKLAASYPFLVTWTCCWMRENFRKCTSTKHQLRVASSTDKTKCLSQDVWFLSHDEKNLSECMAALHLR